MRGSRRRLPSIIAVGCAFLGAAGGACSFSGGDPGTRFRCDTSEDCPGGTTCSSGYCEVTVAGADAGGAVCHLGRFTAAEQLPTVSTDLDDWAPMVAADDLELFVYRPGERVEIWHAKRDQPGDDFRDAGRAFATPTSGADRDPFLTVDGRTLVFSSFPNGGTGGHDLYTATRPSADAAFAGVTPLAGVSSSAEERSPWLSDDLERLYFTSNRDGDFAVYLAERSDPSLPFGNPMIVSSLDSFSDERWVRLTADELEAFVSSSRPGGPGMLDIYHCIRSDRSDPFGACEELDALDTPYDDAAAAPSRDGRELYVNLDTEIDGGRNAEVWRSVRACP